MPSFSRQAILFDLDGVLVDSTPCVSRIWTAWAVEHGLDPAHVVHVTHGQRTIDSVRELTPHLDSQAETDKIERLEIEDTEGLRALPGAMKLLASLPPDRYTIVTSGTRQLATTRLQAVGLPVPPRMITANEVSQGKPNPEPYLSGAALLGFSPETCLVFEDAPSGIRAAKSRWHDRHWRFRPPISPKNCLRLICSFRRSRLWQLRLDDLSKPVLLIEIAWKTGRSVAGLRCDVSSA